MLSGASILLSEFFHVLFRQSDLLPPTQEPKSNDTDMHERTMQDNDMAETWRSKSSTSHLISIIFLILHDTLKPDIDLQKEKGEKFQLIPNKSKL